MISIMTVPRHSSANRETRPSMLRSVDDGLLAPIRIGILCRTERIRMSRSNIEIIDQVRKLESKRAIYEHRVKRLSDPTDR